MVKKVYSAPVVKSEDVVLGVFGNYGNCETPKKQLTGKKGFGSWFFWWLWMW